MTIPSPLQGNLCRGGTPRCEPRSANTAERRLGRDRLAKRVLFASAHWGLRGVRLGGFAVSDLGASRCQTWGLRGVRLGFLFLIDNRLPDV
jgi:hypothetical protein